MTIFVLTGRCPGYERLELAEMLNNRGHVLHPKMTRISARNGAILVASDEAVRQDTSKVRAARQFGATVWSYSRLLERLSIDPRGEAFGLRGIPEHTRPAPTPRQDFSHSAVPEMSFRTPAQLGRPQRAFTPPEEIAAARREVNTAIARRVARAFPEEPVQFTGRTIKRSL